MANLEKAIAIAVEAHAGQADKVGQPYILHVLSVMFKLSTEAEMIVGVLHDVIEDTDIDAQYLRDAGFSEEILNALNAMTHDEAEAYDVYIERVSKNSLATRVKLADLEHNMDTRRYSETDLPPEFYKRHLQYHKAWRFLSDCL